MKSLDPKSRPGVFLALPLGDQYERVLHEAEHSAVTDHNDGVRGGERNPSHHKANFAISLAFWNTYRRDDATAKDWLSGSGLQSMLEKKDRWQHK